MQLAKVQKRPTAKQLEELSNITAVPLTEEQGGPIQPKLLQ